MASIDRKNFFPQNSLSKPYSDSPAQIGWNTTISAPHMHAHTLETLKPFLKEGCRAVDIGVGSGYLTGSPIYIIPS